MSRVKAFFKRKNIEVSLKRYGIDALGAMAQGLFCTLLVGTILDTLGTQLGIGFLAKPLIEIGGTGYTIGKFASAMVGPGMAVAIGFALNAPAMVLFSLIPVGYATNVMGGAGGSSVERAYELGCDTYLTSDIKYDQFLTARELCINLIDGDHFCTENPVIYALHERLSLAFPGVELRVSQRHDQTARFA